MVKFDLSFSTYWSDKINEPYKPEISEELFDFLMTKIVNHLYYQAWVDEHIKAEISKKAYNIIEGYGVIDDTIDNLISLLHALMRIPEEDSLIWSFLKANNLDPYDFEETSYEELNENEKKVYEKTFVELYRIVVKDAKQYHKWVREQQ